MTLSFILCGGMLVAVVEQSLRSTSGMPAQRFCTLPQRNRTHGFKHVVGMAAVAMHVHAGPQHAATCATMKSSSESLEGAYGTKTCCPDCSSAPSGFSQPFLMSAKCVEIIAVCREWRQHGLLGASALP